MVLLTILYLKTSESFTLQLCGISITFNEVACDNFTAYRNLPYSVLVFIELYKIHVDIAAIQIIGKYFCMFM